MLRSSRDEETDSLTSADLSRSPSHVGSDEGDDKVRKLKNDAISYMKTVNKEHLKTFGLIAIICVLLLRLSASTAPPPQTARVTHKSSKSLRSQTYSNRNGKAKYKKKNRYEDGDDSRAHDDDDDDKPRKKKSSDASTLPSSFNKLPQLNNNMAQSNNLLHTPMQSNLLHTPGTGTGASANTGQNSQGYQQAYQTQGLPPPPPMLMNQQGGLMQQQQQQQQYMPQQGLMQQGGQLPQQGLMQQGGQFPQQGLMPQGGQFPQQGLIPQGGQFPQQGTMMQQGGLFGLQQPPVSQQNGMFQQQDQQTAYGSPQQNSLAQQELQIQQQLALLKQQQELLAALQAQNPLLALQLQTATTPLPLASLPAAPLTTDAAVVPGFDPVEAKKLELDDLSNFAEVWDPHDKKMNPIFWHIPKAGGSSVKDAIGSCHRLIMATEFGVTDGHIDDKEIAVVYPKAPGAAGSDRSPFINVDTTTVSGIERASKMGFADSGLAQCVVTPFLWEANALFTPTAKGRLFAVFRHPVDRAISMFYYIQVANWEPSYSPDLQSWTLEQYAASERIENNWMTRQLANKPDGDLEDIHLKIALEVIRRKFLVGTMEKLEESMTRFEQYFKWKYHVNPTPQEACRTRLTGGGSNSNAANKKEKPKPGDPVWEAIAIVNNYDIQVYTYIESLFEEQASFVEGIPKDYRLVDSTCCKCAEPTFPPEGFTCPKVIPN